jgi:hypothetical protein
MKVQKNIVHEYLESLIRNGIPSRLGVHGQEALDIIKPHAIKKFSTLQRFITNSKVHCLAIHFEG